MYWQRGSLTPEHVQWVLRVLPFDLSYADQDDILVFWKGDTYKTCDARYIGRDVRDCHPAPTLACLEEILREFKAGRRDTAQGWRRRHGRLRHVRYFAVRDKDGTYRGILEIVQDVTAISALEGEQELPGWGPDPSSTATEE